MTRAELLALLKELTSDVDGGERADIAGSICDALIAAGVEVEEPLPKGTKSPLHIFNSQIGTGGTIHFMGNRGGGWYLTCSECGRLGHYGFTAEDHDLLVELWALHEAGVHKSGNDGYPNLMVNP